MTDDEQEWFDPSPFIEGSQKLIEIFGEWPSFDDAELISLILDRTDGSPWKDGSNSPALSMTVRFAEIGYYLSEIRFNRVCNLDLTGFSYQNEIQEIVFDQLPARVDSRGSFTPAGISAEIIEHCGLKGRFEFQTGIVLSIVPCDKYGDAKPSDVGESSL
jgi:hypothetical protein